MTPKQQYHLAVLSNAPISNTQEAKLKGELLIETALQIEMAVAKEQAKAEAEKVTE